MSILFGENERRTENRKSKAKHKKRAEASKTTPQRAARAGKKGTWGCKVNPVFPRACQGEISGRVGKSGRVRWVAGS
jgi:hypothetical protein